MDLSPESIIKEMDCVLGGEVGRGAFGAVSLAVLKGSVQACAKVRARCACSLCALRPLRGFAVFFVFERECCCGRAFRLK